MLIDRLCEQYGDSAPLAVRPYVDDEGETVRWFVEIDGREVTDLDVAIDSAPERSNRMLVFLVCDGEKVEMGSWNTDVTGMVRLRSSRRCDNCAIGDSAWVHRGVHHPRFADLSGTPDPHS